MGVMTALLIAFTIGLGLATIKGNTLQNAMNDFQAIVEKLIENVIIPLLPIHIFGIFSNMTYAGQVGTILSVFAKSVCDDYCSSSYLFNFSIFSCW